MLENTINLVEVIRHWNTLRPQQEVLRFYPQGEGDYSCLSFQDLDTRCRAIASQLQAYQGQRALLLFNSGLEFLEAFFACFYAGVIAVPAYPPRKNHHLQRLSALIEDCQPNIVLSAEQIGEQAKILFQESANRTLQQLPWLKCDAIENDLADLYQDYSPQADDIAFLQYTSGSTGAPKGVMVSHANLMANIRMAQRSFGLSEDARCVSWLPLFHDMGLIGSVMAPLYWGAGSVLMPPAAFLQKPLRWLQLLSEFGQYSPVGCTAPNFSYQLCVDTVSDEQAEQLDLSAWVFALTGAEPIRAETLRSFSQKFAVAKFNPEAFVPAYGMAECTVLATCRQHNAVITRTVSSEQLAQNSIKESPDGNLELVSSGSSCWPQELIIVDPHSLAILTEQEVGEIWLKGEHIAQGYWQQEQLSQATFKAYTQCGEGPFLRTGDLGALVDGELFVTGRIKDLLIIRGRNHYPQDIEYTATHCYQGLQADACAAFTIEQGGQEQLVIVHELERRAMRNFDTQAASTAIRQAIAKEHGIEVGAIAFIRFASIAKTSSGKIQRHAVKKDFLQQSLNLIDQWQQTSSAQNKPLPARLDKALNETSTNELAQWIQLWLSRKANIAIEDIPLDAPLDGLGLDSIDFIQLSAELEAWLGNTLDHSLVYEKPDINDLAQALIELAKTSEPKKANIEIEGFI